MRATGPGIAGKIVALHEALDAATVPHAFGGALALAWCTQRARGTADIDLNVFVEAERARAVFEHLPPDVRWSDDDVARVGADGQVRLWWDATPVDLFFATTEFHTQAAERSTVHVFGGVRIPFLACSDLAVFKAFFARSRDWADLEEMHAAGTLDVDRVLGVLVRYLSPEDERVARFRSLVV